MSRANHVVTARDAAVAADDAVDRRVRSKRPRSPNDRPCGRTRSDRRRVAAGAVDLIGPTARSRPPMRSRVTDARVAADVVAAQCATPTMYARARPA